MPLPLFSGRLFCCLKASCVLLLLLLAGPARATHIVGGELELQHQSGDTYRLTLNLYFDDINGSAGALDQNLTVGLFAKSTHQLLQAVSLPLASDAFVAYTNPECESPSLRTRKLVYTLLVDLPAATYADARGYYAAVERCCRNGTINNIESPADAAQVFYLEFPPVVRNGQVLRNSTPRIFPPLSDYACKGELFYFNFGGEDADGDSLVYELATPLNGRSDAIDPKPDVPSAAPYQPIRWLPGYSTAAQILGSPALIIDRRTGQLQVRPSRLGLFVFSIKCLEYRQGVKLGEVQRDFQLKVLNCPPNQTPSLTAWLPNQTRAYVPGRDTLRLVPGPDRCLPLRFTDPDAASQLTLSLQPVNFRGPLPTLSLTQGTVRTAGAPDTLASELCFANCIDTGGKVFLLDVVVADNGCSLPRRDTVRVAFMATAPPNEVPAVRTTAASPQRAKPGDLVSFDVFARDADQDPLTLTLQGVNFDALALGAELETTPVGEEVRGRFRWRVPCPVAGETRYAFRFIGAAKPCDRVQADTLVVVVEIDDTNVPPQLTTTAGATRPLVVRPDQVLRFTLAGTDADQDAVTLTMTGQGFSPVAVGATLTQETGPGTSDGVFTWLVPCPSIDQSLYTFTFTASSRACDSTQATSLTIPIQIERRNEPPVLTTTASTIAPVRVRVGEVVAFDLLATDPENQPLELGMVGNGFDAAAVGAQLTLEPGAQRLGGHFRWQVPCPAPGQTSYAFTFTATDLPCGVPGTDEQVVTLQIDDPNTPPALASTLFTAAAPITLLPGSTLEAPVTGQDAEGNPLTLTARGVGFDLAAAGMQFTARSAGGQATGSFRWTPACTLPLGREYAVVFALQEGACRPQPREQTVRFAVANPDETAFTPPNIFTPNQDGRNDFFELPTLPPDYCAQRFAGIQIFNRWGKPVYESGSRSFRWDGGGLPAGVYFYLIRYTNQRQYKGYVTIAH
ncbi:gliding motility-associated C-terminal domain-containing protein [Hymenobacter sp. BT18]|uniref:gliding motility-associated C-terminal domain-containing protein n=1 Tax=Hymenobacter sp. BT18 TaxID=2835648 RepID=UPI00143E9F22|nr:gliding motility-associated C-terminal domain-containing protein [Hymenobacter sp. BT18]QIX60943.1 gliding motility-associated C-terminal domain-containing protein [Hymenobacter sp. BT18]